MNRDFPAPPDRNLPPEVRDRLSAKLFRDIRSLQRTRLDRARGPLAIAAGVAVLAAGAMVVAQSVSGGTGDPTPGNPPTSWVNRTDLPLDVDKANAKLDRCFAAIQAAGKADNFPPRAQWAVLDQTDYGSVSVTGATAGGKVFFCETTNTEVTVSDPDATLRPAEGSVTSALLQTRLNTFAGVIDLSWPSPWVEFTGLGGRVSAPLAVRSGVFIAQGGGKVAGPINVAENDPNATSAKWKSLPPAPAPAVSIIDNPSNPPADRTSERGRKLDECLKGADAQLGVPDVQSWRPGAVLDIGNARVAMTRNEFGFASCWLLNGQFGFLDGRAVASQSGPIPMGSSIEVSGGTVVSGTVPAACTRMTVAGQASIDISDGTFVVFLPGGFDVDTQATLFDANNRVIYQGRLMNY